MRSFKEYLKEYLNRDFLCETEIGQYVIVNFVDKKKIFKTSDNYDKTDQYVLKCIDKKHRKKGPPVEVFSVIRYNGEYISKEIQDKIGPLEKTKGTSIINFLNISNLSKRITDVEKNINPSYRKHGSEYDFGKNAKYLNKKGKFYAFITQYESEKFEMTKAQFYWCLNTSEKFKDYTFTSTDDLKDKIFNRNLPSGKTNKEERHEKIMSDRKELLYRELTNGKYKDEFLKRFGTENIPSVDDMEQFRSELNINDGRELEKHIADDLDNVLDPEINKDNIKISDKSKQDQRLKDILSKDEIENPPKILHAKQSGDDPDQSDIEVDWVEKYKKNENQKNFFIEAKLDYSSAPLTHFRVNIENGTLILIPNSRVKDKKMANDEDIFNFQSYLKRKNTITEILQNSNELKELMSSYEELIEELVKFKSSFGIKFERPTSNVLPEAFKNVSGLCQKYIDYHIEKYNTLLHEYVALNTKEDSEFDKDDIVRTFQEYVNTEKIFDIDGLNKDKKLNQFNQELIGNNPENKEKAHNILWNIYRIHHTINRVCEDTKCTLEDLRTNEVAKLQFMFFSFIGHSLDNRSKKLSNGSILSFKQDLREAKRRILYHEATSEKDIKSISTLIQKYYRNLNNVAYIQIGKDVYYLDKNFDPLGIITKYELPNITNSFSGFKFILELDRTITQLKLICYAKPNKNIKQHNSFDANFSGGKQIKEITY